MPGHGFRFFCLQFPQEHFALPGFGVFREGLALRSIFGVARS